jgi:hypothetical protein
VEEWIQSVAGVLEQGWNDQSVFLYMNLETLSLIYYIELRHKGHLDSMSFLLGLTRSSAPNGSPWGNNFFFIHHNLLYVPDRYFVVAYKIDLFEYRPRTQIYQRISLL